MKVFITGGAGYVGSFCAKLLRERGFELLIYDNLSTGHRKAVPEKELIIGDLANKDLLFKVLDDFRPDAVMHFAASAAVGESIERPLMYYRNNVVNTINLLEVMEQLGIKKLIFSSSCAVYGPPQRVPITEDLPLNPISPYGWTKRMMEQVFSDCANAWGLGYAALRYFNAAGAASDGSLGEDHNPETHLIPIVLQVAIGKRECVTIFGDDYPTPDGTCIRDYIHVEDLAEAHFKALTKLQPSKRIVVNLGTGKGYSVKQVIEVASAVTGRKIQTKVGPRRPGDSPILYADPTKAKEELDWQSRINRLEDIIASAWEWTKRHPNGFEDS